MAISRPPNADTLGPARLPSGGLAAPLGVCLLSRIVSDVFEVEMFITQSKLNCYLDRSIVNQCTDLRGLGSLVSNIVSLLPIGVPRVITGNGSSCSGPRIPRQ